MRYAVIAILAIVIGLSACSKNCYRCLNNVECMRCVKGVDTFSVCCPLASIKDSIALYKWAGFQCTVYSGLQYEMDVCDDESLRLELERQEYTCTKE